MQEARRGCLIARVPRTAAKYIDEDERRMTEGRKGRTILRTAEPYIQTDVVMLMNLFSNRVIRRQRKEYAGRCKQGMRFARLDASYEQSKWKEEGNVTRSQCSILPRDFTHVRWFWLTPKQGGFQNRRIVVRNCADNDVYLFSHIYVRFNFFRRVWKILNLNRRNIQFLVRDLNLNLARFVRNWIFRSSFNFANFVARYRFPAESETFHDINEQHWNEECNRDEKCSTWTGQYSKYLKALCFFAITLYNSGNFIFAR